MGRPIKARQGQPVKNTPAGFPQFFDKRKQRIVTANPWAFLSQLAVTKLKKNKEAIALACIQHGHEFFEAAQNPRLNSRPLLYYYAFLNVVKAALPIRGMMTHRCNIHAIHWRDAAPRNEKLAAFMCHDILVCDSVAASTFGEVPATEVIEKVMASG
jgi:hypothetical protein